MHHRRFIERSIEGTLTFLEDALFAEEYAGKNGFLQARDPRTKTLAILSLLLAVLFSRNLSFIAGVYLLTLGLTWVSGIHFRFFLKRTWVFIPLFSLCIALPALFSCFTPGEPLVSWKVFGLTLTVTRQGLASAGFFVMRVVTSVSLGALLVLTTRHELLLKVLRIFKVPRIFVMTMGMCFRYVYLFIEVIHNTYTAIKSRVGHVSSVKKGQGIVAWNIASLWQRSYAMHHDVYYAMLSRGYNGEPHVIHESRVTGKDIAFMLSTLILWGVCLWQNLFLS